MKDFRGKDIFVGDKVIFVGNVTKSARLDKGVVTKIYANDTECTVTTKIKGHSHILSDRIMKL